MGMFEEALANSSRKRGRFSSTMERRREARAPLLRTTHTSLTSHLWELELVPAIGLNRLASDIEALSKRSVDQNIFFESEVLLAAWPRLISTLAPHGCWMLCLWETISDKRNLRLFTPVRVNKIGLPAHKVIQSLSNEFMPIGTPLIDKECAGEAAENLLRLLGDPALNLPKLMDFTHQRQTSKSSKLIIEAASSLGLEAHHNNIQQRAALFSPTKPKRTVEQTIGKKRLRELARQLRKLRENGEVTFVTARTEEEVLDAFEGFMTLELKGWKGRRGTALYNHKKIAAFSRQIVAELVTKNGSEIFTLKHDGRPIAALIFLGRGGHLVPWKMAFDESYGKFSPGMQLMLEATKNLLNRDEFVEADSLAVTDHWMMNSIWPDRITIQDTTIALHPSARKELVAAVRAKERVIAFRKKLKKLIRW